MTNRLKDQLATIKRWTEEDGGKQLWDVLTALRGPDSPSERGDGGGETNKRAYAARRDRKYKTGEVIRWRSGLFGGAARYHEADHVVLPPREEWDHYDRHVMKAAQVLGLRIVIEERQTPRRPKHDPVPCEVIIADQDGYKPSKAKGEGGLSFGHSMPAPYPAPSLKQLLTEAAGAQKEAYVKVSENAKYQYFSKVPSAGDYAPTMMVTSQATKDLYEKLLKDGGEAVGATD